MFDVSPYAGIEPPRYEVLSPTNLVAEMCRNHGVHPDVVRGPRRDRYVADLRREIALELRTKRLSLKQIGRLLGNRHHTTVLNLLRGTSSVKYQNRKCGL